MQQIAIISSSQDPAGINIRNNLIKLFDFEETEKNFNGNGIFQYNNQKNQIVSLYLTNNDLIFLQQIDKKIPADVFIFASKHRSKENIQSFAVHPIGNWDKSEFGGNEKELCFSSAVLLKNLFVELNNVAKDKNFEITLEATHHGPYVEKPAVFVEIGSTDKEWDDKTNGEIIATTIINSLNNQNNKYEIAVGIGGPHYCNNFNKVILRTEIAFSHICPKYMLDKLDEDLIKQSIQKTVEKIDFFVLDWKGLGTEKQGVVNLLKNLNLEFKRTDQILKD